MGWSFASQSNSIRGFQDIEMRLPKLFNVFIANFAGKMILSKQRLCLESKLLLMNKLEKTIVEQQKGQPFF